MQSETRAQVDLVVQLEAVEEHVHVVVRVRGRAAGVRVDALPHELGLAEPRRLPHVHALAKAESFEDVDHGPRLASQPHEVNIGVVARAGGQPRAVLVDGEPAEQPQDDALLAGGVDERPRFLRHHAARLDQCRREGLTVHGPTLPPRTLRDSGFRGQESGQGGGVGMSLHPTPSSSSRTAVQSPAEK